MIIKPAITVLVVVFLACATVSAQSTLERHRDLTLGDTVQSWPTVSK